MQMSSTITLRTYGPIGLLCIDNPPVNAISENVVEGLNAALQRFEQDRSLAALVVYANGRTFVAGGDITMFDKLDFSPRHFNRVLARIEAQDRPVVAVLHGTVFGGGLELALACHYRIAVADTKLGLPEVLLGVLPGSLGTQRLPRLAGPKLALDMMLNGLPIDVRKALAVGIVDEIVQEASEAAGIAAARKLVEAGFVVRRTSERHTPDDEIEADFFDKALAEACNKRGSYPAPQRIVRCVEAATRASFAEGEVLEARLFEECRVSPQSIAMRHLFFAERQAAKIPGLGQAATRTIAKVGVVGAGTMGGGIAMNFANAGIPVVIVESSADALGRGLALVRQNYAASAAKGKLSPEDMERRLSLLQGTIDYRALADCDMVIEAVYESLDLKKQVCAMLGDVCKPGAVIASNTSTLDVDVLAQASGRPADFLGMHFFSPASVMRLLEVVRGAGTGADVLATVMRLSRTIGKVPVVSGVCYGFIGNRMLEGYLRESEFLMLEGASPSRIDAAIESLGFAMGPCRMLDLAGLDVAAKVVIENRKAGGLPADASYRAVVQEMLELGRFGQKTGAGYYRYEGRRAIPDPAVQAICSALAARHGIACRTDITDDEIIERCLFPLINEGAKILDEGIAYRPGDIDLVWVNGYGFPDHRGGPMHMADATGLNRIVERLEHYGRERGNPYEYWTRSALLLQMCAENRRFADWSSK